MPRSIETTFLSIHNDLILVVRSLLLFFSIYLLPLILSIIPSFFIVFESGSVFMALLLTGFHLISPHFLRRNLCSKFNFIFFQIFLVVYLKVPSLLRYFTHFYITPFGFVISKNSTKYHLYVDDTKLYISVTPSNLTISLEILSNTFSYILSWVNSTN